MPDLLDTHRRLLERWRRTMNLIGPGPAGEHYEDARLALASLGTASARILEGGAPASLPAGHWADLGTGAGFPGVVLAALHPNLRVDLVDSRSKRCAFLSRVLVEAEADRERIRVVHTRIEDLPDRSYDGLTARALAAPAAVLDHAARLLRPGGIVVLFLQGDAALLEDSRFRMFHVERYAVAGRTRAAPYLVRTA